MLVDEGRGSCLFIFNSFGIALFDEEDVSFAGDFDIYEFKILEKEIENVHRKLMLMFI